MKPLLAPSNRPQSIFAGLILLTLLALIAAVSVAEAAPGTEGGFETARPR